MSTTVAELKMPFHRDIVFTLRQDGSYIMLNAAQIEALISVLKVKLDAIHTKD